MSDDWERTASILGDAAVERDEYRGAITAHRAAIYAPHRTGNTADRTLWSVLR